MSWSGPSASAWGRALLARSRPARATPACVCTCRAASAATATAAASPAPSSCAAAGRASRRGIASSSIRQRERDQQPEEAREPHDEMRALEEAMQALHSETSSPRGPFGEENSEMDDAPAEPAPLLSEKTAVDAGPTLRDLRAIEPPPPSHTSRNFDRLPEEEKNRIREKRYTDALRKLNKSFTLAQLRSLARQAKLDGPLHRMTKSALKERIVSEVWGIPTSKELEEQRLADLAAEKKGKEPLQMQLPQMAWILLHVDSSQRTSIARRNTAEISMLDLEQGTVAITGTNASKERAREQLQELADSVRTINISLPRPFPASAGDAVEALPSHVTKMILTLTHCIVLEVGKDSPAAEQVGDAAEARELAIIGPSEEACDYAGSLLRSYWTTAWHASKEPLLVYTARQDPAAESESGSRATPSFLPAPRALRYHHSPQVLPSTRSWLSNAVMGTPNSTTSKGLALTDMKAIPTAVTRIVRSALQEDSRELYLQKVESEPKFLRRVDELAAESAPSLWQGSSEQTRSTLLSDAKSSYTATIGAVIFRSADESSAWTPPRPTALQDLLEEQRAAAAAPSTHHFLPVLPPAHLLLSELGALSSSERETRSEDVLRIVYAASDSDVRLELELVQEQPEAVSSKPHTTELDRLRFFEEEFYSEKPSEQLPPVWQLKSAKFVQSQAAMVLVPDAAVDLHCQKHLERPVELSAEQLEEIRQYLPAKLPTDLSPTKPALAAPEAGVAGVFIPPATMYLPVGEAEGAEVTPLHLMHFSRILRKSRKLRSEDAGTRDRDAEIDPREAGYVPAPSLGSETQSQIGVDDEESASAFDCFLQHEEIADPGERVMRTEVRLQWVPRADAQSSAPQELSWSAMQVGLQPWLESRHKSLWGARKQRIV